jgi:hypothetical protein
MSIIFVKGMWRVGTIIAIVFGIRTENWVGELLGVIGELTLKEVTLPGTHNSGAFALTTVRMDGDAPEDLESVFEVVEELNQGVGKVAQLWSITQKQDLEAQMHGGIRYFDLRVGWDKTTENWVTYHFFQGCAVEYLLRNISTFLQVYTKEIVVVEISHFEGDPKKDDVLQLKNMVLDILGQFLHPVDRTFKFTINKMVKSGKRAVVTMEKGYDNNNIWPPESIYNTYADTSDLAEMIQFNKDIVQQFMKENWMGQLFKVSWTLTPNPTTLLDSLIPGQPQSLIDLAKTANNALPAFWKYEKGNDCRIGNILIVDHYELSDIMLVVWEMNGLRNLNEEMLIEID